MAMPSVGVTEVEVAKKPRAAIFSTGSELLPADPKKENAHRMRGANTPYIMAVLRDWGVDADFLSVLDDDANLIVQRLQQHVAQQEYNVIISTGAVSTGRFDIVPDSLKQLNARIIFHHVAIRPGHPILFSKIPGPRHEGIAYFGLSGPNRSISWARPMRAST